MTLNHTTILALVLAVFTGCAQGSGPSAGTSSKTSTIEKLQQSSNLFGHQDDLSYGHSWNEEPGRSDIKDLCGAYPAVVGFDLGGIELGDSCNLDGVQFQLMRKNAQEHVSRGGIVTFSWHPRNPFTGGDAWDVSSSEVVASILEGGERHSEFMTWLKRAADFLESVKGEDGQPVPAIFRPWHENTGSWFWWGQNLCTDAQYQALWDLTYSYMVKERGLTSLIWAFSPGAGVGKDQYMSRYPGDGIIDILGLDAYQYATSEMYQAQLRDSFSFMKELAAEHGKIMALTEFGYEGIPQADWWTSTVEPVLKEYPVAYLLAWRNAHDKPTHYYVPFVGSDSAEDFKLFYSHSPESFIR